MDRLYGHIGALGVPPEAVPGNVGSSGDALECLGRPFLGVCDLHIYKKGDHVCVEKGGERWKLFSFESKPVA